jgi:hypothetical protein
VNGGSGCSSGACLVTGGTGAGSNLFHRFNAFDTRGAITGVTFDNTGFNAVMVGVLSPTVIDKTVALSQAGSLFWLSPGGISVQGGGGFQNVTNLTLSTATGLRVGSGVFDAWRTTAEQAALLSGAPLLGRSGLVSEADTLGAMGLLTNGDLSIDGGLLTVDQNLLLDAQGGHVLLAGAQLVAGERLGLSGASLNLQQSGLDASNTTGVGGEVRLEGQQIDLRAVQMDASGRDGGGSIFVGGGYRGLDPAIQNAEQVVLDAGTTLQADAIDQGDGGLIVVYANDSAAVEAHFSAHGGARSGHGGLVETSAASLSISDIGAIDLSAPAGLSGTWLIDPTDFSIVSSGNRPNTIRSSDLSGQLALNSVVIATDNANGSDLGDIDVESPVTWGANRLTLSSYRNINVNADLIATGSGSLSFHYGQGSADGAGATYVVSPTAKVEVPLATDAFIWKKGSSGIEYPVVLDNGSLRFWVGSDVNPTDVRNRFSFNGAGVLQQPAYVDVTGAWRKLTYSSRPLEFALGYGGDGSSNWNTSGTILGSGADTSYSSSDFSSLGLSNGRMDVSRYLEGAGTVITRVDLNPPLSSEVTSTASLRLSNQYTLAASASSVRVDATIQNLSTSPLTNLRYWYGTGDDWINQTDLPTKTRGNLTESGFAPLTSASDPSNAIRISDGAQAVIFYSPTPGTATSGLNTYGSFLSQVVPVNPLSAPISATNDGSYGLYLRYPDIAPQGSASSSYIYTTGSTGVASSSSWDWTVAQPIVGSAEYDWFNPSNWIGGLPGNDFAVSIPDDPGGQRMILFDPANYYTSFGGSTYSLRLSGLASSESLRIASGSLIFGSQVFNSFQFSNGSSLAVDGGSAIVNGALVTPELSLQAGNFSGSGRVSVTGSFIQSQGQAPALSSVTMGRQFDSFNIDSLGSMTLRELYANGGISVSAVGDLVIEGSVASGNGDLSLSALGSAGLLQLQSASRLNAPGGVIALQADEQLNLYSGSFLDASTSVGAGGTIYFDSPNLLLEGLANSITVNTSGFTTGGDISIGTVRQPLQVRLQDVWLLADPPLTGGNIAINGLNISSVNSIFDVTGGSGGSIAIGNAFSNSINIQGGSFIGGGGANFALTAASISTSGLTVNGGALSQFLTAPVPLPPPSTPTPLTAPAPLPPPTTPTPLTALAPLPPPTPSTPLTAPVPLPPPTPSAILFAASSSLTQTPLKAQELLAPSGDFTAVPLNSTFDPNLEPAMATTLESSTFLYADDYFANQSDEGSREVKNSLAEQRTKASGTTQDSDLSPAEQGRTADPGNAPAAVAAPIATALDTERSAGQAAATPTSGSSDELRASVTTVSSAEAAERFSQGEAKAQSETAEKLGLTGGAGTPPTPAQIQGLLQRVMQSLRDPSSSSR